MEKLIKHLGLISNGEGMLRDVTNGSIFHKDTFDPKNYIPRLLSCLSHKQEDVFEEVIKEDMEEEVDNMNKACHLFSYLFSNQDRIIKAIETTINRSPK